MDFSNALEMLKDGYRIQRFGWNGKGMWLELITASTYFIHRDIKAKLLPWIGMKTADDCFAPWLASQTDILAEDWMVVE